MIKRLILLCLAILTPLLLAGCRRSESFRWKLTLTVDTPEGVKSGYSVVEVRVSRRGLDVDATGEAVYVDLGPGNRSLIALLSKEVINTAPREHNWGLGSPTTELIAELYGEKRGTTELLDHTAHISQYRGPREMKLADLPDLVTFADINEPGSVRSVDPKNLSAALGRPVKWRSIMFEITNEAVTAGIEQNLTWLAGFVGTLKHPGPHGGVRTTNEIAEILSLMNFKLGNR